MGGQKSDEGRGVWGDGLRFFPLQAGKARVVTDMRVCLDQIPQERRWVKVSMGCETNLRNWAVLFPLRAQLAKVFGVCLPHMQRISVVVICMASVDAGGPLADEPDMK